MIQKDFYPHQDQQKTAGAFGGFAEAGAGEVTEPCAGGGDEESQETDEGDGRKETDAEEGEGHADGEGVDACGDCKREHGFRAEGAVGKIVFAGEGFADHVCADRAQKNEGDPVVDRRDVSGEAKSQKI